MTCASNAYRTETIQLPSHSYLIALALVFILYVFHIHDCIREYTSRTCTHLSFKNMYMYVIRKLRYMYFTRDCDTHVHVSTYTKRVNTVFHMTLCYYVCVYMHVCICHYYTCKLTSRVMSLSNSVTHTYTCIGRKQ